MDVREHITAIRRELTELRLADKLGNYDIALECCRFSSGLHITLYNLLLERSKANGREEQRQTPAGTAEDKEKVSSQDS